MTVDAGPRHDALEVLAAFAVAVRAAGVAVTTDRTQGFLAACAALDAGDPGAVYWAGRATLCAGPDDIDRYDHAYEAWFRGRGLRPPSPRDASASPRTPQSALGDGPGRGGDASDDDVMVQAMASRIEVLRSRDIAELSAAERARLHAVFGSLRLRPPTVPSARRRPARRGPVDGRRTLRAMLRAAGEPTELRHWARSRRPRRIVILVDVSGSMAPYADSLLRFAHLVTVANPTRTEVFTIGTRLTRVTRAMRLRDGEAALRAAGQTVPDWSGGTRLGDTLKAFLDRWGQRGAARGAVVVVMSDGWERGDADLLAEQMRRLHRVAHRVVWANPHRGRDGYQPVQAGIVAALPHIDAFVPGHSMAAFQHVLQEVADA